MLKTEFHNIYRFLLNSPTNHKSISKIMFPWTIPKQKLEWTRAPTILYHKETSPIRQRRRHKQKELLNKNRIEQKVGEPSDEHNV
jgi:hypothetical protein